MSPQTSIIIRTKNEERWIGTVLNKLFAQTYHNFEIIIIDSGSTDQTLKIVKKYPVKLLTISPKDFSYPYALNYAIKHANATSHLVILSAHSLPISTTWLADGLENFRRYPNIMGVYGHIKPLPKAGFWDKFFINTYYFLENFLYRKPVRVLQKPDIGVLGFTNAIISKSLWEKRHLNEDYGLGGEDGEWASYWFKQGYEAPRADARGIFSFFGGIRRSSNSHSSPPKAGFSAKADKVVKDSKFTIFHSHNLNLIGWIRELQYWYSLGHPKPFKPLPHRKNKTNPYLDFLFNLNK